MTVNFGEFETKKNAVKCMRIIYECAEKAGIKHALFVNFGLLLGIVRHKDFIPWDNDIDMCVRADLITPEQELKYFHLLHEKDLFYAREKICYRPDEKGFDSTLLDTKKKISSQKIRLTWFSLRKRANYTKFCHWFMFPWNGCYWHTKSGVWINDAKFPMKKYGYALNDDALMKGIPTNCLDDFITVNFYGINLQVPKNAGSCLDFYYPGWLMPRRGGASAKKMVCIVKKWQKPSSWRMVII